MENATDALKIAFAVFVFVIAITITFSLVSQAKSTADTVLFYADKTSYYDIDPIKSKLTNRTVSISDVISTLNRYGKESVAVTVNLGEKSFYFDIGGNTTVLLENVVKINSAKDREENLKVFKQNYLDPLPENTEFIEEFVEVQISGIIETGADDTEIVVSSETGADGTEIIVSSVGKKVYVTYTKI